jgi:hypothetical protein
MSIEVLIVQTEAEDDVPRWIESAPTPRQREWEQAALGLVQRATDQRDFRAEIFLCLKADYLVDQFEYMFCRSLCEKARDYGWGAKVYIAVDERVDLKPEQFGIIPHLDTWLRELHKSEQRASDIVLANFDRMSNLQPYHIKDLRRARDESATRYDMLPGLIIPDRWYCWAASSEYKRWLDDVSKNEAHNLIIVIKDGQFVTKAVRLAEQKIAEHKTGRFVVGCLARGDLSPIVADFGRRNRIPILKFRGLLELRYFLLRLNHLCQSRADVLALTVEAVNVERQIFQVASRNRPRLLITSAFHPSQHETNCLDAVKDVGIVSRSAPSQTECYIHPYFRADDLTTLLKRMPELTAWLHLGHGDESGLRDTYGNFIKLEDWFARLQHSGAGLPLMFLSVCKSAAVARKFAESGVGVAIGFEEEVLPEMCRALAAPVLSAALETGGSRRAILQAYNEVFNVAPETANIYKPKAYYSVL